MICLHEIIEAEKTGSKNQAEISKMLGKNVQPNRAASVEEYAYDIFRNILHTD